MPTPRKEVSVGDANLSYFYAGKHHQALAWPLELVPIKQLVEILCNYKFNFAVVNLYENGNNYIGWHSDDEKDLDPSAPIVSVSFGAQRKFRLRRKDNHKLQYEIPLSNRDILIMRGKFQQLYQHMVPKEPKCKDARINITFRRVKTQHN